MEGMTYEQLGWNPVSRLQNVKKLQQIASSYGLIYSDKRTMKSNTIMAHLLTEYAEAHGGADKNHEVSVRLLKAYFGEAADLKKDLLLEIASEMGFDVQDVERYITDPAEQQNLIRIAREYSVKEGISGVPFFYMNGRPTFSGAQDPEVIKRTILKIAQQYPLQQ